jgi:hypothetical protein
MKRLFGSIVLSLVGLAIFIMISIFSRAIVGQFIVDENARTILFPVIFIFAVLVGSLPWVFAAHLTSEESWKQATKLLYFLPVFLAAPSFILPAITFAVVFTAARFYYIKREVLPYRTEVLHDEISDDVEGEIKR